MRRHEVFAILRRLMLMGLTGPRTRPGGPMGVVVQPDTAHGDGLEADLLDLSGIDRIYAVALDRVTRSMRDAVVRLEGFEKAGVDVHFVHQPELTFGAQGRFLRHVLAAFAEFERDMIATRIAESRAYLKQHGRRLAGKVPFGYDADPVTKQLTGNPAEAPRDRYFQSKGAARAKGLGVATKKLVPPGTA